MKNEFEIHPLQTREELLACVALQKETWGKGFTESVPPSLLLASQKVGGVAAGAFTPEKELVGFVFGISGIENGKLVHWSDMLAVKRHLRNRGLGWRLKIYQRSVLLAKDVHTIYWSYDPLEARNAHLNFNKLGVTFSSYVKEMYPGEESILHRGLGTDRFVVAWKIQSKHVEKIVAGETPNLPPEVDKAPVVTLRRTDGAADSEAAELPADKIVRVEVPANIQREKQQGDLGRRWRACTRRAFLHYSSAGYQIGHYYKDDGSGRCFYVLTSLLPC